MAPDATCIIETRAFPAVRSKSMYDIENRCPPRTERSSRLQHAIIALHWQKNYRNINLFLVIFFNFLIIKKKEKRKFQRINIKNVLLKNRTRINIKIMIQDLIDYQDQIVKVKKLYIFFK